ncbi:hypothetical protein IDH28_04065 [Pelagibacterales bacterium SAG-MED31]|nr:hypothetical protein [Pelagibacterales bacterium SAG-MED31]
MIDSEKKIAEITLKKLQNKSWDRLTLDDVLNKSIKTNKFIKTKIDLLKNINRYVDDKLIERSKNIESSSSKDMLFEVLMARFDILQENRVSFIKIFKKFKKSPKKILALFPSFLESMIVTAELAKLNVNGLKGSIRLKGLFFVYFLTFNSWANDTTTSLEKTMNALDNNLDQAEKFNKYLK